MKVWLLGVLFLSLHVFLFIVLGNKTGIIIWSDADGYYQYLPQLFYYGNITHLPYSYEMENGMMFNKYTCGTAILQSPFFFLAHIYCKLTGQQCTGYSAPYAVSIWLAAITYVYFALVLLYQILLKWFRKITAIIAVMVIYWGTNLFYYAHFNPGYSHVYSFFILTLFVYRLDKFLERPDVRNTLYAGIPLGLALLIRPTNVFYLLLFLLWNINSFAAIGNRIVWLMKNFKFLLVVLLVIFVFYIPQMMYWHEVTGKYIVYAYKYSYTDNESFIYWQHPKIGEVLLGLENGWLIYSPVFFFFIIGLVYSLYKRIAFSIPVLVSFVLITYANASWWTYSLSCSYGHRAFIEYYPLFIIPLAFLLQKTMEFKKKLALIVLSFFMLTLTYTSCRWSYFFYYEQCWEKKDGWKWISYNRAWNKAFYLVPQDKRLKW